MTRTSAKVVGTVLGTALAALFVVPGLPKQIRGASLVIMILGAWWVISEHLENPA